MILKIRKLFTDMLQKLVGSIKRFPEAVILAASTTAILIALNHTNFVDSELNEMLGRIAMVLALGIPLSLCLRVLFEKLPTIKNNTKLLTYFLSALGLLLYFTYLLPDYEINTVTRYIALSLALYCGFAFIPYIGKRPGFEQHVVILIRQFLITALYSLVLFIGLIATVFTVDQLLFKLPSRIYLDIWLMVVGLFAPTFFLSDIPIMGEDLSEVDYSKVLKALLFFIVMPLITVYTLILYFYFAKILITRQWPVGMVSHLVLWYALVTIFVSFVIYPQRNANRWVNNFLLFIPKLIIPLLLMMFVAMGIRIKAYGITENRYFVLLAGIWALGSIIYFSVVNKKKNVILAITLACIMVLGVFGPWSAYSVSKHSQNARFAAILERNQMLQDGTLVKAPASISDQDKREISSIVIYFNQYHNLGDLKYLPEDFKIESMENSFGFPLEYYYPSGDKYFYFHVQNDATPLVISDYDYFYTLGAGKYETNNMENNPLEVNYQWENKRLIIKQQGEEIYSKDLNEIGVKLYNENVGKENLSQKELSFTDTSERLQVLYIFKRLGGYEKLSSGQIIIDPPEFHLFVKLK